MQETPAGSVPMTLGQRLRLAVDCLPFFFFAAAFTAYLTVLRPIVGTPKPLFWILAGLVLAVTAVRLLGRLRDLASGSVSVEDDRFVRILGGRHSGRSLVFERLGTLRAATTANVTRTRTGEMHRITHSRFSRILWRVEPLD